jgi:hypothetical protein
MLLSLGRPAALDAQGWITCVAAAAAAAAYDYDYDDVHAVGDVAGC